MSDQGHPERFDTIVIGGGQSGLSVGYHLAKRGLSFVILDANQRVGDSWRARWDSLRLFTPARFDGLSGFPFPAPRNAFPTKDEMADYLESYARRFQLPIRTGASVDHLTRYGESFKVEAGNRTFEARNVVVAMSNFQKPRVPAFAAELGSEIVHLHSSGYRNPSQLAPGGVLIVGAGNSGAEIATELAPIHPTWVAGRDTGHVPIRLNSFIGRIIESFIFRIVFHRLLSVQTPLGRKARAKALTPGGPLIRTKPKDLAALGVKRVPRVAGVQNGKPLLEDGSVLDVANVIWCTGFNPGFTWIDLPVHGPVEPMHKLGVVPTQPGLYFVGLHFLRALSSGMIHGVGRDAEYIAEAIEARTKSSEGSRGGRHLATAQT